MKDFEHIVACCGCGFNGLKLDLGAAYRAPVFHSRDESDKAVREAGWTVEDGNHRCPKCGPELPSARPGAYIDIRLLSSSQKLT